jgi:hypothetical protein
LTRPLVLADLKKSWLEATEQAEAWFARLPAAEVGCLYLDPDGKPCMPDPLKPGFSGYPRHQGSVGGSWPKLGQSSPGSTINP